ncbi:MAG: hypothetical protein H0W11_07885 [Gemmatimonadetes bacterium]|nr:hypothetical protein [Gemmatimonadota bacterium]
MDETLTLEEINTRFASEWVLIVDPDTDDALEIRRGRVRFHSKDRDKVYRKAIELRPSRLAMLYTGTIPDGTAVVL